MSLASGDHDNRRFGFSAGEKSFFFQSAGVQQPDSDTTSTSKATIFVIMNFDFMRML
jgi:hypothetical protein